MDEQPLYRVCPHRNVPAAFQPFLGTDSGGIDRFFDNAVERELFCGRLWHRGVAVLASNWRGATRGLLADRADAATAVYAALRPLAVALWIKAAQAIKGPARGGAFARVNGRRLAGASCIHGVAAASPFGAGIPTLPGIPLLLPVRRRPLADSFAI